MRALKQQDRKSRGGTLTPTSGASVHLQPGERRAQQQLSAVLAVAGPERLRLLAAHALVIQHRGVIGAQGSHQKGQGVGRLSSKGMLGGEVSTPARTWGGVGLSRSRLAAEQHVASTSPVKSVSFSASCAPPSAGGGKIGVRALLTHAHANRDREWPESGGQESSEEEEDARDAGNGTAFSPRPGAVQHDLSFASVHMLLGSAMRMCPPVRREQVL